MDIKERGLYTGAIVWHFDCEFQDEPACAGNGGSAFNKEFFAHSPSNDVKVSAGMSSISLLNPLTDPRWRKLVATDSRASVFHQPAWLEALTRTYGYEALVLTTSGPQERLANGIVLCRLSSWLTGSRLVSLPFSDHCQPLIDGSDDIEAFVDWLRKASAGRRYVELRPLSALLPADSGMEPSSSYCFHELDLSPSLGQLYSNMHPNSFQRKVRRAKREGLSYESALSEKSLLDFYRLLLKTRRRHRLIPQPLSWFKNLVKSFGENLQIRLARKNGTPIAAMLTLRHGSNMVYKYGCSDEAHHNLGGMPFLFWRLIEDSKEMGATKIDLGRSDFDNAGLITFKDRLGAARRPLTYYRFTNQNAAVMKSAWQSYGFRMLFSSVPDTVLSAAGAHLYRHLG